MNFFRRFASSFSSLYMLHSAFITMFGMRSIRQFIFRMFFTSHFSFWKKWRLQMAMLSIGETAVASAAPASPSPMGNMKM